MIEIIPAKYDFAEDQNDWLLRRRWTGKPASYVKARFPNNEQGVADMKALRTALNKAIREAEQLQKW